MINLDTYDWADAALVTDTHFCHRPPTGTFECRSEEDDQRMFEALQVMASPTRILIHLGDVVFGLEKDASLTRFITPLDYGMKILIRGNHDKTKKGWYDPWFHRTYKELLLDVNGKSILFSHEPLKEYWLSPIYADVTLNVHGHFHDNDHRFGESAWAVDNPRYKLLAIEHTGLSPVRLGDFVEG